VPKTPLAACFAAVLCLVAAPGVAQDDSLSLKFDIILSGITKMGTFALTIRPDAAAGVLVVDGEQHIDIRGRKIDIVWTEKWRDQRLVAFDGHSRINRPNRKAEYTISLSENGQSSLLSINGESQEVPADIVPHSWWRKDNVVGRTLFFALDDGTVREETAVLDGEREVRVNGKDRKAELWKVRGERNRDFWFLAGNGVLAKYQRPRGAYWYTYQLTEMR
jgi:hypothetical protein